MPSFDIVSEVDKHELKNAIDQANREISGRFDFKGSNASISQNDNDLTLEAESKFQVKQMHEVLYSKMSKRGLDLRCLEMGDIEERGKRAYQPVSVKSGLGSDDAKKIVKMIKQSKIKVQAAIQGEQVRVSGKKRDDLQQVIALMKNSDVELPLQFNNFRD